MQSETRAHSFREANENAIHVLWGQWNNVWNYNTAMRWLGLQNGSQVYKEMVKWWLFSIPSPGRAFRVEITMDHLGGQLENP